MTQEDKDLLLKDLCCRLPYGVKCQIYDFSLSYTLSGIIPSKVYQELYFEELDYKECNGFTDIKYSKPYLFPISSMTEKQKKEWRSLMRCDSYGMLYPTIKSFDYLYKNHIDICGFIPKGWAKDATGLNIY